MSGNYFNQIIFPTIPKPPILSKVVEVRKSPPPTGKCYQPIQCFEPVKSQDHFEFWFVEIIDKRTGESWTQLLAACPVCDTSFIVRYKIKSKEIMLHALKAQSSFYMQYVKDHCPYCYPGNPILKDD